MKAPWAVWLLVWMAAVICGGCGGGGGGGGGDSNGDGNENVDTPSTINSVITLTADNAAAVGGLGFTFADGAVFGFPNQQVLLTLGADGTTYTLEAGTTMVTGTSAFAIAACTFTDDGATMPRLDAKTCNVDVRSTGAIPLGESGDGEVAFQLRQGGQKVASALTLVKLNVADTGDVTINNNALPILDETPEESLPPFACICSGLLAGLAGFEDAFACADFAADFGCTRSEFATQPDRCSFEKFDLVQCCIVSDCAQACSCPAP